ncbi:MAG: LysR family transcriptional regulator [Eubacterium sp.]|nr:LysR family transcriptional regulator [Eubacterium sp.]
MTLNQLRYFTEIVRQENFTRAAEHLFITQSALSKSVRALEEEFQVKLIDRNAKGFQLTQEGNIFYERALQMLAYMDTQTRELRQIFHEEGGTLNIGIPPTAGSIFFYSVLQKFCMEHSNIKLNLEEVPSKKIYEELENGKLDMGVVLEPFVNSGQYICQKVCISEIILLVSDKHPLANRRFVSVRELENENFLMMSSDYMFHHIAVSACKERGLNPNIVFESSQWDLIFEMTAANQGISFFPEILIKKQNRPDVKILRFEDKNIPWILSMAYKKDKFLTFPMRCFLDACTIK